MAGRVVAQLFRCAVKDHMLIPDRLWEIKAFLQIGERLLRDRISRRFQRQRAFGITGFLQNADEKASAIILMRPDAKGAGDPGIEALIFEGCKSW